MFHWASQQHILRALRAIVSLTETLGYTHLDTHKTVRKMKILFVCLFVCWLWGEETESLALIGRNVFDYLFQWREEDKTLLSDVNDVQVSECFRCSRGSAYQEPRNDAKFSLKFSRDLKCEMWGRRKPYRCLHRKSYVSPPPHWLISEPTQVTFQSYQVNTRGQDVAGRWGRTSPDSTISFSDLQTTAAAPSILWKEGVVWYLTLLTSSQNANSPFNHLGIVIACWPCYHNNRGKRSCGNISRVHLYISIKKSLQLKQDRVSLKEKKNHILRKPH